MKTFEIHVTAYTSLVVQAKDEAEALEIASEDCDIHQPSGWEIDDWSIARELTEERAVEAAIRHSPHHDNEDRTTPYA